MNPFEPTHSLLRTTSAIGVVLMLFFVVLGCERDETDDPVQAVDTSVQVDAAADFDSADGADDANDDTADTLVADLAPDIDEGPRELVNGTPVRFGHVVDGDTLDVFVGQVAVKVYPVRLRGINAPECTKSSVLTEMFGFRNQCTSDDEFHGLAAREGLVSIVSGKEGVATCDDAAQGQLCPTDDFGRYLVYVEVDGRDVATEMAFQGHAFSFTSFAASKRAEICAAEMDAQQNRRGMWANGTVDGVISLMNSQTQRWYNDHHDSRCAAALAD